jgi:hypothetical protein
LAGGLPNANLSYVGTNGAVLDAKTQPLADNGGRTFTCALLSDSAAINHGTNLLGLTTDQRAGRYEREFRKQQADIGAYEFGAGAAQGALFLLR